MLLFSLIILFVLLAVGLTIFLLKNDKGEKEPVGALWLAAIFGLVGAVVAAVAEQKLLPVNDLKPGTPLGSLFFSTLGIGAIEETCKFLPLALFIYSKRYFNEHTDGIIYFALAGLGFGLPENILYTLQFGAGAGFGRLILTPFFHAAITGMVGYFLAKQKLAGKNPLAIWPYLLAAILLHGVYDFGLSSGNSSYTMLSIVITLGLSVNFFILFMKAGDLDREEGLSVAGHNSFCRTCGIANAHHHLYCTHCGMRA
jgi:RsiW-degrading membrane proteinase PrsW (M82 family)